MSGSNATEPTKLIMTTPITIGTHEGTLPVAACSMNLVILSTNCAMHTVRSA
ncbi:hypothetical protein SXCC_04082 [Gluconacetobacter sp. SXCC-1]|nr:hypothetical protein SXCC_04082 [Gluconacetobacter sp. SXCC-1]